MDGKASADMIRASLEALQLKIEGVGHGAAKGYWVGDKVGSRQAEDDLASGRTDWDTAWRFARNGLTALDAEDADLALAYLLAASSLAVNALGLRLSRVREAEGLRLLAKPARPRGRKKSPTR